jgi:exopolysaccharide biosynthesis polyprenyl glycosylphosphotransferase
MIITDKGEQKIRSSLDSMVSSNSFKQNGRPSRSSQVLRALFNALEITADFVTAVFAVNLSYFLQVWLSTGSSHVARPAWDVERIAIFVAGLIVLLLKADGAYRGGGSLLKIRETERALRSSTQACCLLVPVSLLFGLSISRPLFWLVFICLPICQGLQKQCVLRGTKWLHTRGIGVQRTIVYGAGSTGRRLLSAIWASPKQGWHPILVIDDNPALWGQRLFGLGYRRAGVGVIAEGPITQALLLEHQCDLLIIAVPSLPQEKLEKALAAAQEAQVRVAFLSDRSMPINDGMESVDIDGLFLIAVGTPQSRAWYNVFKRIFDTSAAAALLLLFTPLFLLVMFLISSESNGSPFFRQDRVGKQGSHFKMWKFRSMYQDVSAYEVSPVTPMDSRITKVGRFLRKTSFDELPQLINVLTGDMSLVGPRPEMPFLVDQYNEYQRQRLEAMPGITGLWQLSADRAFHIHENIQYDLYYFRHRGFFMDLAILLHTIIFAVRGI